MEFAPPVGYKEPDNRQRRQEEMAVDPADLMPEPQGFVAFKGEGNRLDGKKKKNSESSDAPATPRAVSYSRSIV